MKQTTKRNNSAKTNKPNGSPIHTDTVTDPSVQLLTSQDFLDSMKPTPLKIPNFPRKGVTGLVFIRPPSAKAVTSIFGQRSTDELKGLREELQDSREAREQQMARLIAGLVEDGNGNLLFTQEQADQLLQLRYNVFQTIAEAIDEAFRQSEGEATDGAEGENPFVQTDSSV